MASWGVLVLAALALWVYATRGPIRETAAAAGHTGDTTTDSGDDRAWWRRPKVWLLTAAFSGQAFAYYGVTAWLPLLLRDELGMAPGAAGLSASIFQIAALVGAFGVPVLLRVLPGPRGVVLIVAVAWATLPLGLLLAPSLWPVWCAVGGAAQGGGLVAVFSLVVRAARDLADNRRISALVQGGGYVVAASGPTVVGAVHEATGGGAPPCWSSSRRSCCSAWRAPPRPAGPCPAPAEPCSVKPELKSVRTPAEPGLTWRYGAHPPRSTEVRSRWTSGWSGCCSPPYSASPSCSP